LDSFGEFTEAIPKLTILDGFQLISGTPLPVR
jgi:hypothetical protein